MTHWNVVQIKGQGPGSLASYPREVVTRSSGARMRGGAGGGSKVGSAGSRAGSAAPGSPVTVMLLDVAPCWPDLTTAAATCKLRPCETSNIQKIIIA